MKKTSVRMKFRNSIPIFLTVALFMVGCASSPKDEIGAAEAALRAARDARAQDCAPKQFQSAEEMMAATYRYDDAEEFDKAKDAAITAKELAEVAKKEAESGNCDPAAAAASGDANRDGLLLDGRALSEEQVNQEIAATKTGEGALGEGTLVRGLKPVFFAFDQANLTEEAIAIVTENAEWLQDRPTVNVQIEGHTDDRGTAEYNLALGERRAKAVREAMKRLGIEETRIAVISYGEEMPVDPDGNEAAWAQNRRAEFVVK